MIGIFERFDPITEPVHTWSDWVDAQNIIRRARALVRGRSKGEIIDILRHADRILDAFFENEFEETISLIMREGDRDLIEYDKDGQFERFRPEAYDQYDIRDRRTVSDVDALEEALEVHFDALALDIENLGPWEYYGCLALSCFERFVSYRDFVWDPKALSKKKRSDPISADDRFQMQKILLEALDCVSRGEREKVYADITERYEKKIEQLKGRQDSIVQARIQEMTDAIKSELASAEAERRKQESIERNDVRHQKNRDLKARVVGWYASEYRNFPSAAKAAKAFCQRLSEEGIEREQRTIENWLRSYAKQHGIALTP